MNAVRILLMLQIVGAALQDRTSCMVGNISEAEAPMLRQLTLLHKQAFLLTAAHEIAWPDMPCMIRFVAPAEQERSELARQDTGGQHL